MIVCEVSARIKHDYTPQQRAGAIHNNVSDNVRNPDAPWYDPMIPLV
jgi:hypothetical protein